MEIGIGLQTAQTQNGLPDLKIYFRTIIGTELRYKTLRKYEFRIHSGVMLVYLACLKL